tara:strand:- start:755 stop:1573 length:819 start_codon:yes stop_codon:yes gene_type:complete
MTGTHTGKQASPVEFTGSSSVFQRSTRGETKTIAETDHTRRYVNPISWSTPSDIVDSFDNMRTKLDPTSNYSRAQVAAHMRQMDDQIIASFFDDAITGETASGTTSFDSANVVAVGSANFTLAKILEAKQLLMQNEVDMDDPETVVGMAITPDQYTKFVQISEVSNSDFGNTVFDKDGRVTKWNGIDIVISNRLTDAAGILASTNPGASATREIPMWAKSGMHLGLWEDIRGKVVTDESRDRDPLLVTTYSTFGATRCEEAKVIKIIVDETA